MEWGKITLNTNSQDIVKSKNVRFLKFILKLLKAENDFLKSSNPAQYY